MILLDTTSESTDTLTSLPFSPTPGAVSTSFVVISDDVDVTVSVDLQIEGNYYPYIVGREVTAGEADVITTDLPSLKQRVRVTPASGDSTNILVMAVSAGQK